MDSVGFMTRALLAVVAITIIRTVLHHTRCVEFALKVGICRIP
jgi:hypothetical protein